EIAAARQRIDDLESLRQMFSKGRRHTRFLQLEVEPAIVRRADLLTIFGEPALVVVPSVDEGTHLGHVLVDPFAFDDEEARPPSCAFRRGSKLVLAKQARLSAQAAGDDHRAAAGSEMVVEPLEDAPEGRKSVDSAVAREELVATSRRDGRVRRIGQNEI